MDSQFPRVVEVLETISTRYKPGERPISWEDRSEGVECFRATDGEVIKVYSKGGQSSPSKGWVLLLTKDCAENLVSEQIPEWTLYGLKSSKA